MSWISSLQARHGMRLKEASYGPGDDPDLYRSDSANPAKAYRQLSADTNRELHPIDQDRMIEIAIWLFEMTPLASRIITLEVDFILGTGFAYSVEHDGLKDVLDAHWQDPINNWDLKQYKRFLQLYLMGEACWPAFVRREDGRVRLGYLDPANIKSVVANPMNIEELQWVQVKTKANAEPLPPFRIIHVEEDERSENLGLLVGEPPRFDQAAAGTFYTAVNNLSNQRRGRSDLLAAFDWLDLYDQFTFGMAERSTFHTDVVWDVTLEDYDEPMIKDWLSRNPTPQGRQLRAHNQKIQWNAVAPTMHAVDADAMARLIRHQAMTRSGIPEGWIFSGADSNLATLQAQSEPILRHMSRRQGEAKATIKGVLEFVRDQAIIAKKLPRDLSDEQKEIVIEAAEVSPKDLAKIALTCKDTAAHLVIGKQQGWVTHEESALIFRTVLKEYGVELSPQAPPEPVEPALDAMADELTNVSADDRRQIMETYQAAELTQAIRHFWEELTPKGKQAMAALAGNGHQ